MGVIGVVGAGAMGIGIAEVAARAGEDVLITDANPALLDTVRERVAASLQRQAETGASARAVEGDPSGRIRPVIGLDGFQDASVVIEAVYEDLAVKHQVLADVERAVDSWAILATNTSSLSITRLASALQRPERLVGMHFFNPVPAMRLVEVVRGAQTDPGIAATVADLAQAWGKIPVVVRSTPGFLVNRIARPYYGESLRLLEEGFASPDQIDRLMVLGGGFRMGPFTLMDFIGHDVNFAVTTNVFDSTFFDPRYRPSLLQAELVEAGWLGRKSGRGFYEYPRSESAPRAIRRRLEDSSRPAALTADGVVETDGRSAAQRARDEGGPCLVHDLVLNWEAGTHVAYATSPGLPPGTEAAFVAALRDMDVTAVCVPDLPGLAVMRVAAMLVNEGFEAVHLGVSSREAVDQAAVHGLNYPLGPFALAERIGLPRVVEVLDNVAAAYGDPRYRCSIALRAAATDG